MTLYFRYLMFVYFLSFLTANDHWLFSEDCLVQRFCSAPDGVMVCGNADGREVYAVTQDIVPGKGWVMQFKVIIKSYFTYLSIIKSRL